MTSDIAVPKDRPIDSSIPITYVPARNTVFLSLALAWYNRKRLPEQKVFDYAAMLAFRGPAPDGVKALPLTALGVPEGADNDPAVESLFQKLFGTTMVFIMAHETGHLFHGHRANVDDARSRQQEGEADAFAVEMMARMGAPPIGISFYFMMAAPFECADRSTHPLSGERINRPGWGRPA